MGTHLIMTVGTNALPLWVAWHHLKHELETPIKVWFVHTPDTLDETNRLAKYFAPDAHSLGYINTAPGNPKTVRDDVEVVLNNLEEFNDLHVHYTGGTKVMSVESVASLEYHLPAGIDYYSSYLDPRGGAGPTIIDSNGVTYDPPDARSGINVDLKDIAFLNGFELAPFVHEYYDRRASRYVRINLPERARLNQEQETGGNTLLNKMATGNQSGITPTNFEHAAYVALKQALERIKVENPDRTNYEIFHSVYVRRAGAGLRDANFELDVVAVLGYQIVVVSCTLNTENAPIKEKGMEVIIRARQLGGDEAQTIVLCQAHRNSAPRIERELQDQARGAGAPVRVWGTDKWTDLSNKFYDYLRRDLHWL